MGENQGMVWIILGVVVVAAAVLLLGNTMTNSVEGTTESICTEQGLELNETTGECEESSGL